MAEISVRIRQLSCAANSSVVRQRDECNKVASGSIYNVLLFLKNNLAGFPVVDRGVRRRERDGDGWRLSKSTIKEYS